jgi:hypothetical protein
MSRKTEKVVCRSCLVWTRAITAPVLSRFASQKLVMVLAKPSQKDLTVVPDLIEAGRATPAIDRCLSEVPDAIRYLEEGHARGKVVITLGILTTKPNHSAS